MVIFPLTVYEPVQILLGWYNSMQNASGLLHFGVIWDFMVTVLENGFGTGSK